MNTWEAKTDYLHVVLPGKPAICRAKSLSGIVVKKVEKSCQKRIKIGSGAPNIIKRLGLGQPQIFFIKIGEW